MAEEVLVDEEFVASEKKYICFDQLGASDRNLYVALGDYVVKTGAIYSDAYGLYFEDFEAVDDLWICKECKEVNGAESPFCTKCKELK